MGRPTGRDDPQVRKPVLRGRPVLGANDAEGAFDALFPLYAVGVRPSCCFPIAMTTKPRAAISWSGGKDSCAAFHRVREHYDVVSMITMFDEDATRSRSHGLRPEVVAAQADRLGIGQVVGRCTWNTYNEAFARALDGIAASGLTHVVFGDIMFDEHRRWAEGMCAGSGLTAVEPLWGESTDALFDEWVASGAEAIIVTARAEFLDSAWLGRPLAASMGPEFARLGVDKCGERGEYHTVVTRTPLFSHPLSLRPAGTVHRSGCWALDVQIADASSNG
jgi:diphthine-ammonia ligase